LEPTERLAVEAVLRSTIHTGEEGMSAKRNQRVGLPYFLAVEGYTYKVRDQAESTRTYDCTSKLEPPALGRKTKAASNPLMLSVFNYHLCPFTYYSTGIMTHEYLKNVMNSR
jgi:hypothetical protein